MLNTYGFLDPENSSKHILSEIERILDGALVCSTTNSIRIKWTIIEMTAISTKNVLQSIIQLTLIRINQQTDYFLAKNILHNAYSTDPASYRFEIYFPGNNDLQKNIPA